VLQQHQENPLWGKAIPNEIVSVTFANNHYQTQADASGDWLVKLAAIPAGGPYKITVQSGNKIELKDILIGEVWLCSGQSNMVWPVKSTNHAEVELASAIYPNIRLLDLPSVGSSSALFDIETQWKVTTPNSVSDFSAICYFYGRRLHQTLQVPIGLISSAWGGSRIEAWLPRDALEQGNKYQEMLDYWDQKAASFDQQEYEKQLLIYNAWEIAGKPKDKKLVRPRNVHTGRRRPANIFNGMVNPIVGYGIRGAIWYQGESNAKRGYQYSTLFPLLINTWRDLWGQGDFPFYWLQLADYKKEKASPSDFSGWAELREAQTMTLRLPNTGQAVIFDLGEGRDIHPRNKQDVANRLVRHPLAKVYGFDMMADSPIYNTMHIEDNKIVISFTNIENKLYSYDSKTVKGFYIAGKDQVFVHAKARITGKNSVEIFADDIAEPIAVRYGWEDNPVINLYDKGGLPVTSFRTDDWPLGSRNVNK
jgi:sialate O-acetylesterase